MTNSINPEMVFTLDDAVMEVLGNLTGQELSYQPELDRYQAVTRQLNRALRSNALEHEWGYYSTLYDAGLVVDGIQRVQLPVGIRPRAVGDDAVQFHNDLGQIAGWAYVLPRDALSKYRQRFEGLWCAVVRNTVEFNRPIGSGFEGLHIMVPAMREPVMFRLPKQPEDPEQPLVDVPQVIRDQPIDFCYPDVITVRAAFYYAQTDPIMQPRVQTLEAQYKDLMYQVIERDDRFTDSPFSNEFFLPIQGSLVDQAFFHMHPHSDARRM